MERRAQRTARSYRHVILLMLVPLAILLISWTSNLLVKGQVVQWNSHVILRSEERPYTTPDDVSGGGGPSFRSTVNSLLYPRLRDMQRYCDGQCFYAPTDCDPSMYNCKLIASIAMHSEDEQGELYCNYFGTDNLKNSFCHASDDQIKYREQSGGKPDVFYTITLHRVLGGAMPDKEPSSSCPRIWNDKTGRKCKQTEFIGISFIRNGSPRVDLHEDDLWYICTADEPSSSRVGMWTRITNNPDITPVRIIGTRPHRQSGMGVVFSKVVLDGDTTSMGCQFVLQESNMTLPHPPNNTVYFSEKETAGPITVKLATGYVQRGELDVVVRPFYKGTGEFAYYQVYTGADIKPTNEILFESLAVKLEPSKGHTDEDEAEAHIEIDILINKCANPHTDPDNLIVCYTPNGEENCVHNGNCDVMFIVEVPKTERSFQTIQVHLYSRIKFEASQISLRRPFGYAAIGFSHDAEMGGDATIVCHADGIKNITIHVSINFEKTNIYPGNVKYDHIISNPRTIGTSGIIVCSWEMKTAFSMNMTSYWPDYEKILTPELPNILTYNFTQKEVFLMMASGNANYPGGRIVYHDFRQVLKEKFSKKLFFKKAGGSRVLGSNILITLCFLVAMLHYFNL